MHLPKIITEKDAVVCTMVAVLELVGLINWHLLKSLVGFVLLRLFIAVIGNQPPEGEMEPC